MFHLNSPLNFGIPPVLVFQLVVYYKVDRLLTGLTAQQKGTTVRWYSSKTSLHSSSCLKWHIIISLPCHVWWPVNGQCSLGRGWRPQCCEGGCWTAFCKRDQNYLLSDGLICSVSIFHCCSALLCLTQFFLHQKYSLCNSFIRKVNLYCQFFYLRFSIVFILPTAISLSFLSGILHLLSSMKILK